MVLGFKEKFVEPINLCSKIHTIRVDKNNRWRKGLSIQFATGVRTKNYKEFAQGFCVSTQEIEFRWFNATLAYFENGYIFEDGWGVIVYIDGKNITKDEYRMVALARGDGFKDVKDFLSWEAWHKKDFKGKIIHWTDTIY